MNPDVSGGWSHSKSMKKFQDQLLYGSQVGTESSCFCITSAFEIASLNYLIICH